MPLQVTTPSECFITDAALICFLSSVCESVLLQVATHSECFITYATFIRFLSSVYEAVLL